MPVTSPPGDFKYLLVQNKGQDPPKGKGVQNPETGGRRFSLKEECAALKTCTSAPRGP